VWDSSIVNEIETKRQQVLNGNPERIAKQHTSGKLTARERINILFDTDTFHEINSFMESRCKDFGMDKKSYLGDGVVTGYGKINGRLVFVSSQDFTVNGGSLGEYHAKRICRVMDMALDMKAPFVSINDSGGARIEEGIDSLNGYAEIFHRNIMASGIIPQISVIMGPCAGGACYSPALTDFIFMVRQKSYMFITGPAVIKAVTYEDVTPEALGGADMQASKSGVAHFVYDDDQSCLEGVRRLLSYLPQSAGESIPLVESIPVDLCRSLPEVVTDNQKKCYDVRAVIGSFTDKKSFFEVHTAFAKNAVIGFARLDGKTIGCVANQPNWMSGVLDIDASDKIARFVRFCNCFHIPLVTFVDVPGYMPGKVQESSGIIRHGAKILYAYSEATVPKITVILRKAYGGAYIAMCSKGLGADIVYAWPTAEIAVMGAEGAVNIVAKKIIEAASDSNTERQRQIEAYEKQYLNPYIAASRGYVDEVIMPDEMRSKIVSALNMLTSKKVNNNKTQHGNMPL